MNRFPGQSSLSLFAVAKVTLNPQVCNDKATTFQDKLYIFAYHPKKQ